MRYIQRIDGKSFDVEPGKVTRWACCDCGLVHDIAFVIADDRIGVAAHLNKRATAARRRKIRWEDGVVSTERERDAAAAVAQGVATYVEPTPSLPNQARAA